ncbi:ATP-binding protein [Promineifilum sp.]|uniref:GAF domain-containing sensor histidine kinase n=1 Tax=Promineifilum sp. TaxID=2664178 RepID=UPI0035B2CDBB
MPRWLRNSAGAALILTVVFGIVGTLSLLVEVGRSFGGYMSYGFPAEAWAGVAHETPDWWPPLADGSLRYGDRVLAIDGLPHTPNAWDAFARAQAEQRPVVLTVDRRTTGEQRLIELPVRRVTWADVIDVKLPEVLVGLVLWLLGVMVLRARPDAPANRVFVIAACCVAIHRLTAVTSLMIDARWLVNLPKIGHMVAAGLIGPLLVHLALVFPTPVRRRPPGLLLCLFYALGLISGMVLAASRLPWWAKLPHGLGVLADALSFRIMLVLLLVGVLALLVRLVWSWFHERQTRRQRRAAGIVLLGLLGAMPAIGVILVPLIPGLVDIRAAFWHGLDLRYLLLVMPITFAYVIVRYQTFRGPSRLFIYVIVLSLSALLAAALSWLWGLAQPDWPTGGQRPPFAHLFTGIFLASLIWSTQATWRGWFGRVLDWEPQSYEATRRFGRRLAGQLTPIALARRMTLALVEELHLARAAVWLWQPERGAFELAAEAGEAAPPLPARLTFADAGQAPEQLGRFYRLYIAGAAPAWLEPLSVAQAIDVVIPLVAEERPLGLLGLGHRWDEEIFDARDLAIAELIGQQATLFLLAATQVEQLRDVPRRVVEAQESERRRLAAELHDTVQQFLGRLPFALSFTAEQIRTDPEALAEALERALDDIETTAETVRGIRFNLAPSQLASSLERSLNELAARVERRNGLPIALSLGEGLDEATTPATREALYRVVQQALDNVVDHAGATAVRIRFECVDDRVTFAVTDNGRGSTEAERHDAQTRQRFGLFSMRARVELCGGGFDFASALGEGTTVAGWVPAAGGGSPAATAEK